MASGNCPVCAANPESADLITHGPCEDCGSSDACAVYADNHTHCYSCNRHRHPKGPVQTQSEFSVERKEKTKGGLVTDFEFVALGKRKINQDTCQKWRYGVGKFNGKTVQVANYIDPDTSEVVAQKLRFANKDFLTRGDFSKAGLYGRWLWQSGGRKVVITEGEVDALTVSQLQKNKWPVVSLPNGVSGSVKAVSKDIEWLESFDEVVFMFDMDEVGQAAAVDCALLLTPGKAKIATLPYKDANECLIKGEGDAVVSAMWQAKTYRPDGVVDSNEALALLRGRKYHSPIMSYPFTGLQESTKGVMPQQIITICAGSGMGKSEFTRELGYSAIQQGLRLGYVALEESVDRTLVGLCGIHMNKRLHLEDGNPAETPGFMDAFEEVIKDKVFFYDHFGSMEGDSLIAKLKYMRVACNVDVIILDHISIVVSGMEDGDERRTIDNLMTRLRSLTQETGVTIFLVSHLKRPSGVPHEEGGRTSLAQLRGSAAIGQLSDLSLGLERDQQADGILANVTAVRKLKDRRTGDTGVVAHAIYDKETGRMTECANPDLLAAAQAAGGDF